MIKMPEWENFVQHMKNVVITVRQMIGQAFWRVAVSAWAAIPLTPAMRPRLSQSQTAADPISRPPVIAFANLTCRLEIDRRCCHVRQQVHNGGFWRLRRAGT